MQIKNIQKQHRKPTNKLKYFKLYGPVATIFGSVGISRRWISKPEVDYTKCLNCRKCEIYCPVNIIEKSTKRGHCITINNDYCKGCGICANVCPSNCIRMA